MPEQSPQVEPWRKDHWWTAEELREHYKATDDPERWAAVIQALRIKTPEQYISWRRRISPTIMDYEDGEKPDKARVTQIATWYRGETFDTGIILGLWKLYDKTVGTTPQNLQGTMTLVSRDYRGIQLVSACSTKASGLDPQVRVDMTGLVIEVQTIIKRRAEGIWIGILNELDITE